MLTSTTYRQGIAIGALEDLLLTLYLCAVSNPSLLLPQSLAPPRSYEGCARTYGKFHLWRRPETLPSPARTTSEPIREVSVTTL